MEKNRGFTLIELMVTIGILAIIATMAAPSFGNFIVEQKLRSAVSEIKLSIDEAKSQAATLKAPVALCLNKTALIDNVDADQCARTAPIVGYTSMSSDEQLEVQKSRVILAKIDPKVAVAAGSATTIIINEVGSFNAGASFNLCNANKQKNITVTRLGIVTEASGTC